MKTALVFTLPFLALALCAFSQPTNGTNWVSVFPTATYYVNPPESTAGDIVKVFQDFGVNLSVGSVASVLGLVVLGARLLRKAIPDNLQTGQLAQLLKHVSLEINPVTPPSPVKPPAPVSPAESK
jgi:hypothetical protein